MQSTSLSRYAVHFWLIMSESSFLRRRPCKWTWWRHMLCRNLIQTPHTWHVKPRSGNGRVSFDGSWLVPGATVLWSWLAIANVPSIWQQCENLVDDINLGMKIHWMLVQHVGKTVKFLAFISNLGYNYKLHEIEITGNHQNITWTRTSVLNYRRSRMQKV